jgi:MFS transporter, NNP family, nitrate/nitrite transporter
LVVFTLGVLWTLMQLTPNPDATPAIAFENQSWFPVFLGFFMLVFASTGIGNGSTYKMIPSIFRREAEMATTPGTAERDAALVGATKKSSAAVGIIGAVGAVGGFLIPIAFNSPWVDNPLDATKSAFIAFTVFYAICALVTFVVYLRPQGARVGELADVRI